VLSCDRCGFEPPYCDACVDQYLSWLGGTAAARGYAWADRVRARLGDRAPAAWPAFEGRCAAIARRLVGGLCRDERVNEQLAERCWAEAKRRYETRSPGRPR
jgi:hypothetical protein